MGAGRFQISPTHQLRKLGGPQARQKNEALKNRQPNVVDKLGFASFPNDFEWFGVEKINEAAFPQ